MKLESLYRRARVHGLTAREAIGVARRYISGPLADYRAKLAAWEAEPDKRWYAPGGIANRPTLPTFYRAPEEITLRQAEKPHYIKHDGWFTDEDQSNTLRPRVWLLPHGRFLAGYDASDWDMVRIDRAIYDDEREAWHAADNMAERDAEEEREHNEKWNAAREVYEHQEEQREELREAHAKARGLVAVLRDLPQTADSRATICDMIRECRARMHRALRAIADDAETLADYSAQGVDV